LPPFFRSKKMAPGVRELSSLSEVWSLCSPSSSEKGPSTKVAVLFYASWDGPGLQMVQLFKEFAALGVFGRIGAWALVDAEKCEAQVCDRFEVTAVPSLVLVSSRKAWRKTEGADAEKFRNALKAFDEAEAPVPEDLSDDDDQDDAQAQEKKLTQRLKQLTSAHPVILFMKGNPKEPQCKFSRRVVDMLDGEKITFASFDILKDQDVRQGLKSFSQWPTFPQLYVHGDFVGGVDVLTELKEDTSQTFKEHLGIQEEEKNEDIDKRLDRLTKAAQVVLFMKGDPAQPRCGFSRTICGLLTDAAVPFDTFDILQDQDVRQGLKEYSKWPTFPQLYVNGEFVGGLDIVQEMANDGNLKEQLLEG